MALVRGQLAAVDVAGIGILTDVYTVPVDKLSDVNINIANRSDAATSLRVVHIKNGVASSVTNKDYILHDVNTGNFTENTAPVNLTGILMEAGDTIAAYSSTSDVSVQVNGIEGDI